MRVDCDAEQSSDESRDPHPSPTIGTIDFAYTVPGQEHQLRQPPARDARPPPGRQRGRGAGHDRRAAPPRLVHLGRRDATRPVARRAARPSRSFLRASRRSCSTRPTTRRPPRRWSTRWPKCRAPARRTLILSISHDKDVPAIVRELAPHFDRFIVTQYQENPRAVPAEQLAEMIRDIAAHNSVGRDHRLPTRRPKPGSTCCKPPCPANWSASPARSTWPPRCARSSVAQGTASSRRSYPDAATRSVAADAPAIACGAPGELRPAACGSTGPRTDRPTAESRGPVRRATSQRSIRHRHGNNRATNTITSNHDKTPYLCERQDCVKRTCESTIPQRHSRLDEVGSRRAVSVLRRDGAAAGSSRRLRDVNAHACAKRCRSRLPVRVLGTS